MRRNRILRILKFALFAVLFVTVFSFVVLRLWNWLMPAVFGWHVITFWQAVGLLVLSKILFGGFRGVGGRGGYRRHDMGERWKQRTPEEREKFRQDLRACWRQMASPESKPST